MRQNEARATRRQLARRFHADGLSIREIAARLGVSRSTAHRALMAAPSAPAGPVNGVDRAIGARDRKTITDDGLAALRRASESGSVPASRELVRLGLDAAESEAPCVGHLDAADVATVVNEMLDAVRVHVAGELKQFADVDAPELTARLGKRLQDWLVMLARKLEPTEPQGWMGGTD